MTSPITSHVGQVFIPVRDMAKAVEWYATLLGLDHDRGILGHGDTIFDIPTEAGPRLCLDSNHPDFVASGPARFFLWTADMEATLGHLRRLDVEEVSEVQDIGSLSFVTFPDPDGNVLMVAEPR